jgi:glycosyltransferase involved in cell wall biosynthesis
VARRLGIAGAVRWLGHKPPGAVPALYGAIDLLVVPSRYEGFGLVAAEAMAAGDAALLQDLVRGAYNDAAAKVKEAVQAELSAGMGDLPFPPGMLGGL